MCGFAGWIDWQRDLNHERATVEAMTATMHPRGPDGSGVWLSRNAALGHRRLAIIDLAGGAQPMQAKVDGPGGGRVCLVFSGEIYNFRELRERLRGLGHEFTTASDTEVLLRSYLQWGADCVHRISGMFAFAVWDERTRELVLARDPLGIKPLYYAMRGSAVLFGSEPKALLANPLCPAEVDTEGLAELFGLWPFKTPGHALYRGIRELRPGRVLVVSEGGVRETRYWSLESRPHTDDPNVTAKTVRELLTDAVSRQLVADVPLCGLLSGGLDSSLVVALAARSLGRQALRTFSVDFVGSEEDFRASDSRPSRDLPYAREVAQQVGTEHREFLIESANLLEAQEKALRARDLPTMGDIDASLYLLFREVSGQVKVALSGESADESFGGYPWFAEEHARPSDMFPWHRRRHRFGDWLGRETREQLRLDEYVRQRYDEALGEVPHLPGESGPDRRMREVFHLNLSRFLPALLDRKDRMSMAVGLEIRVPYCDHRLVEYLWNVPWAMKSRDGVGKALLRNVASDLVPDIARNRPKSAYPSAQSARYDDLVRQRVREIAADRESPLRPMLDPAAIEHTLASAGSRPEGQVRLTSMLAILVSIDSWLREYRVRLC
ncbi:asparagine synthase (glutamine-hydrolyzing) [Allorhizocola rhizosphaerae]|uniref:asparagine synthase (glutamine-hydrolyzing) n=1 Tax=Allorhizocola rhizosphaerae TaxID=1872709 RepID=UPI000E3CC0C2|nr:asparagine synthase (glutamine-hydrolyzing) [Allorhizocola rhizosphaerae]